MTELSTAALEGRERRNLLALISQGAWILLLLALPITSFPFFPSGLGGGTLVRPLSVYPLLVLLALAVLPRLWTGPLPRTLIALAPFLLAALLSSLLALIQGIEPALGVSVQERMVRAGATLLIGAAFYLAAALYPRSRADLRASLRWIYAGFALALLWGSLQAVYVIHFNVHYFNWIERLQDLISIRRLMHDRISGMTYEPNWFAEQINFLLLPWLLASVLSGYSLFRRRWRFVTVELVLLAWAVLVLPFTFSRAGLAILILMAAASLLLVRAHFGVARQHTAGEETPARVISRPAGRWSIHLLQAGVAVAVLAGLIFMAGSKNVFFARIWGYWLEGKGNRSLSGYLDYLGFGARFTYAETAFNIFEDHPLLGVGLGNYAFYFPDELPYRPLAEIPEVRRLITPEEGRDRLITSKNLYLRLLAETGIVGAAAFAAFVIAVLGSALFLWMAKDKEERLFGVAGLLGLIAFLAGAVSFDSFAIPNMWIVFGLITASTWVFSNERVEATLGAAEQSAEG